MAGAAACEGCDAGSGSVRMKATSGRSVPRIADGKGATDISVLGGGVAPVEASATSLVNSWVSFFAPVSTRRAVSRESRSEDLKAIEAFRRSRASW
jgi:hypothetical protein